MMEQRVSLITLGVEDPARAAAFYEALGWRRVETEDQITVFQLLSQVIGLYPKAKLAEDLGVDASSFGPAAMTLGYNVRAKKEVAAICALVPGAGGRVLKEPHDIFWGGHSAFVADPDGHAWEISWNPFSPPREDGTFHWNG
ncbi:MAG: VOC family protein [Pseudomonadota bacterium]